MFGLSVIGDLIDRSRDLHAHYTDLGVFPRHLVALGHPHFWINVYMISGAWSVTAALFIIHGIIAACVAVGYRLKWTVPLLWLFCAGIMDRNHPIGHGGDMFLRCISFWMLFLPLGKRFALDNVFATKDHQRLSSSSQHTSNSAGGVARAVTFVANMASICYIVQVAYLYVFSAFLKTHDWWTTDYLAAYYALRLDYFRTIVGDFLLWLWDIDPVFIKFFTWATFQWELWGPVFYIFPWKTQQFRFVACILFILMHVGFGSTLRLGLFLWITVTAQLAIFPAWFWDSVLFPWLLTPDRAGVRIYYNSDCRHCSTLARFLREFLLLPESEVLPLGSASSAHIHSSEEERYISSGGHVRVVAESHHAAPHNWVVIDRRGVSYYAANAFFVICRMSPVLRWLAFRPIVRFVTGTLGDLFMRLTHSEEVPHGAPIAPTFIPREPKVHGKFRSRAQRQWKVIKNFLVSVILLTLLVGCFVWNVDGLEDSNPEWVAYTDYFAPWAPFFGIDQYWGMFAPRPPDSDFWYVIESKLGDNSTVELWKDEGLFRWEIKELTWEPPVPFHKSFRNHRWYKYFEVYNKANQADLRLAFGRFMCREWNKRHLEPDEKLVTYTVWVMEKRHLLDGTAVPLAKTALWEHCVFILHLLATVFTRIFMASSTPVLYSYWRSTASWRVRLALNLKGIRYEYRAINLLKDAQHSEEFHKINPLHAIPALEIDGHVISQSMAIIEYIEETRKERPLLPADPFKRALARQIALAVCADIHPVQNLRVLKKVSEDQKAREDWARHWITVGFQGIEALLVKNSGKCCVGDEISIADICLVPQIFNARRFNVDLAPFPHILRIEEHLSQLPEFKASHPTEQPDAQK